MTPITPDGRLSAKDIFSRAELHELHTAFHRDVGEAWGLERGGREEKRKHLDTEAFKHKTQMEAMRKELEATKAELDKTKADLSRFGQVQQSTARVLAKAEAWSAEKARQAIEAERQRKAEAERQRQADQAQRQSRGPRMGR